MPGISSRYTLKALQQWFCRLEQPWESQFDDYLLKEGQKWYRKGIVRELDIDEDQAVVTLKDKREIIYAVIDWDAAQVQIRSSRRDWQGATPLAIAGLYEIEELITDALPPIWEDTEVHSSEQDTGALLSENASKNVSQTRIPRLTLEFKVLGESLIFNVVNANKRPEQREAWILLATLARKAKFEKSEDDSFYILQDPDAIIAFVQTKWEQWSEHFNLKEGSEVGSMRKGIQDTSLELSAELGSDNSARVELLGYTKEQPLTRYELKKLIHSPKAFSWFSGKGFIRIKKEQKQQLQKWWAHFEGNAQGNLPLYMLYSLFAQEQLPVKFTDKAREWHQELESKPARGVAEAYPFLRHYQADGVEWLHHVCEHGMHPVLADEMGLGKTVQILTLLSMHASSQPSLVVCPASVCAVWASEVAHFFPGKKVHRLSADTDWDSAQEVDLWIASYSQLRRQRHQLDKIQFHYAILDEAQYIKNPGTKTFLACLAIKAKRRIALSGTPFENKFRDIWTIYRFLMPGLLGSLAQFEAESKTEDVERFSRRLRAQLSPFMLRRCKSDVLKELPSKSEFEILCPMTERQLGLYKAIASEGMEVFGKENQKTKQGQSVHFFSWLTRLRQACCDPALIDPEMAESNESGKLKVLLEKLEEVLSNGHKVLVFSQFTELLKRAESVTSQAISTQHFKLTGKSKKRHELVERFQSHKGAAVFWISLKAGGTGLTLHSADYVFLLDPWWNPAVEAQAIDRAHRIGQENPVFVYRLIAQDSIEEQIQAMKHEKAKLSEGLIGDFPEFSDLQEYFGALDELIALKK